LAADEDDPVFGEFLVFLTKLNRQAHLRAGIYAKREWKREDMAAWAAPQRASEVRGAVKQRAGCDLGSRGSRWDRSRFIANIW
jgi:hypothetical protein